MYVPKLCRRIVYSHRYLAFYFALSRNFKLKLTRRTRGYHVVIARSLDRQTVLVRSYRAATFFGVPFVILTEQFRSVGSDIYAEFRDLSRSGSGFLRHVLRVGVAAENQRSHQQKKQKNQKHCVES